LAFKVTSSEKYGTRAIPTTEGSFFPVVRAEATHLCFYPGFAGAKFPSQAIYRAIQRTNITN
jgi:hypothetical protein